MKRYLFLITVLIITVSAFSQQFGGNPPSLKWKQIKTGEAKIIFPAGLDTAAQRTAAIAHYLHKTTSATAGNSLRKITIVLQNQATTSNGYVGLAPWRSEFYLTPSPDNFSLGSLPWIDNLTLHEYRHVQQYMNYRKGLSKLAYIILGEEGQAVANNAAIPNWFFEGDAVFQETAVSEQGRGRLPYFFNAYRSLWQSGKEYSFMKLRNGSLRHFIPDHYALGYLLTAYGREAYGDHFWTNVTDDAARFRGLFYPFQKAVKKYSKLSYKNFVNDAFLFYKKQDAAFSDAAFITQGNNHYVSNYIAPYFKGSDTIIALKKTYRERPAWYMLSKNGEKKIRVKDIGDDDYYAYAANKIVYTAMQPSVRWDQRDYSIIKILDINTNTVKQLTHKSKYYTPGISDDGKRVAAVEFLPDQHNSIHIIDAGNGQVLEKISPSGDIEMFSFPKFYKDNNIIASARNKSGMMSIVFIDINTKAINPLIPWSYNVNGYLFIKGDTLFYSATSAGHDNIFAINIPAKNIYRLTNESLGAYQPCINENGKLAWSSFTPTGYQLKEKQLSSADWQPVISTFSVNAVDMFVPNGLSQTSKYGPGSLPQDNYTVSRYSKLSHPFNFHSWRPYYEQPEWSFTLYGENVLNTFQSQVSYTYNENEQSHQAGLSGTYGALFPWITGGAYYAFDRKTSDSTRTIHWDELNANIGLTVPLNFTSGRWYKFLSLSSSYNINQLNVTGKYKDSLVSPLFQFMQSSVSWTSQVQKATQNINPRYAQTFLLRYRNMIDNNKAHQLLASGSLYFPGIGVNHSIVLTGAFQQRDTVNRYRFSNLFPFARGYEAIDAPRMWKLGANYHFPLWYPDWGFGQIVYFLRVRANAFFDNAQIQSLRTKEIFTLRSTGAEIYFDTKWWNQQPVSFGIRYSRLLDTDIAGLKNANRWEFIMPVNLISR
ncbi:hypothetical protein DC498_25310 [Terrimonas sp.]|uniref:hypothetical protein n=1 Tax=Terrimonas sp. TaxID=1914338 RepID=UPI000D50D896|nr:hypothetical protein [Terrimonas sp.]PVD49383.1 hypothetical protein DC498_25310 [Terrimonas sp.]